jgi:hypothetical protein
MFYPSTIYENGYNKKIIHVLNPPIINNDILGMEVSQYTFQILRNENEGVLIHCDPIEVSIRDVTIGE